MNVALIEDPSTNAVATPRGQDGTTQSDSVGARTDSSALPAGCSDARPVEGSSVGVSIAREMICKLADTSATLELEVHDKQVTACAYQRKHSFPSRVRIVYASADIPECRMDRIREGRNLIWIAGACFVVDTKDAQRVADWLVALGIRLEDPRS